MKTLGILLIVLGAVNFLLGSIPAGIIILAIGSGVLAYSFSHSQKPADWTPAQVAAAADPQAWETQKTRQRRVVEERKQQAAANGVACCPRCGSTSLSINKKGFGGGKATAGMFAFGLGGAVAGTYGMNKMKITCLNCGYKYRPGKKSRV